MLDKLDTERVGLKPLKTRIRAFAALLIVDKAGGAASTGRERILDMQPEALHQRVPVILGSKNEVEWVVGYHNELGREEFKSPLFNVRNLYVQ